MLKAAVRRAGRANPRRAQGFPLTAGAQNKENPVQRLPVRHAAPMAAQGVRLRHVNGKVEREPLPKGIRNAEFLNRSHALKITFLFAYSDSLLVALL